MKKQIAVYLNIDKVREPDVLVKYLEEHIDDEVMLQRFKGPKVQVMLRIEESLFNKIESRRGLISRSTFLQCFFEEVV